MTPRVPPDGERPGGTVPPLAAGPAAALTGPAARQSRETSAGARKVVDFTALVLTSVTLMVMIFLLWELIEKKFFRELDMAALHGLYITRGIMTALVMVAWSAWFILRDRRFHEAQQRRMRAQLSQAEKLSALGQLTSGLAHEINNPIGILSSRLELMARDAATAALPEGFRRDLDVLRKQTDRVAALTRNLLNFARKAPLEFSPVSLAVAVENVLHLVQDTARKRGVRLERIAAPNLPPVWGSQNHLEQVILNLVKNALEAVEGRPDPLVRVAVWHSAEDRRVRFHVSDNGPGFSEAQLGKVFDPFYTTKENGTGLGLSVSYGIVEQHGGEILVPSRGPGGRCGTCFLVSLPAMALAVSVTEPGEATKWLKGASPETAEGDRPMAPAGGAALPERNVAGERPEGDRPAAERPAVPARPEEAVAHG